MQLADEDDEAVVAIDVGLPIYFVYYEGIENDDVPRDVTHVRIDLSVRAIKNWAFSNLLQLRIVIFYDELEEIGASAFAWCISLLEIGGPAGEFPANIFHPRRTPKKISYAKTTKNKLTKD